MVGAVRTAFALGALTVGALQTGCAFPVNPPRESCQQLSQCPAEKRDILFQINAGGPAVPPFAADTLFTDGASFTSAAPIELGGVDAPAPERVYETYRYAPLPSVSFQYTFTQLDPARAHFVRLHFVDTKNTDPGQHLFDVHVNGQLGLNQVDIILEAGGPDRVLIREFGVHPDTNGVLQLEFVSLPEKDVAQVSAIEIWRPR